MMASVVEVVDEEPLVTRVLPDVFEPVHMDQFAAERDPIPRDQLRVRQIHGQDGIVFLHIRAEQQERRTIQPQLELGQETRVVEIDAVGIAFARYDIAAMIKQGKGITRFECPRPAFLEGDVRLDVKRRRFLIVVPRGSRRSLPSVTIGGQAASR